MLLMRLSGKHYRTLVSTGVLAVLSTSFSTGWTQFDTQSKAAATDLAELRRLMHMKQFDEATELLEAALKSDPNNPSLMRFNCELAINQCVSAIKQRTELSNLKRAQRKFKVNEGLVAVANRLQTQLHLIESRDDWVQNSELHLKTIMCLYEVSNDTKELLASIGKARVQLDSTVFAMRYFPFEIRILVESGEKLAAKKLLEDSLTVESNKPYYLDFATMYLLYFAREFRQDSKNVFKNAKSFAEKRLFEEVGASKDDVDLSCKLFHCASLLFDTEQDKAEYIQSVETLAKRMRDRGLDQEKDSNDSITQLEARALSWRHTQSLVGKKLGKEPLSDIASFVDHAYIVGMPSKSLIEFEGKVVLLHFFHPDMRSTTEEDCLEGLHKEFVAKDFVIVGIAEPATIERKRLDDSMDVFLGGAKETQAKVDEVQKSVQAYSAIVGFTGEGRQNLDRFRSQFSVSPSERTRCVIIDKKSQIQMISFEFVDRIPDLKRRIEILLAK